MKWATVDTGNPVCTIPTGYVYDNTNNRLDCDTTYWSTNLGTTGCSLCDATAHRVKAGFYPTYTCNCDNANGYYDVAGVCVYKACALEGQQSGEECWKQSGTLPNGCIEDTSDPDLQCKCDTTNHWKAPSTIDGDCICNDADTDWWTLSGSSCTCDADTNH